MPSKKFATTSTFAEKEGGVCSLEVAAEGGIGTADDKHNTGWLTSKAPSS